MLQTDKGQRQGGSQLQISEREDQGQEKGQADKKGQTGKSRGSHEPADPVVAAKLIVHNGNLCCLYSSMLSGTGNGTVAFAVSDILLNGGSSLMQGFLDIGSVADFIKGLLKN